MIKRRPLMKAPNKWLVAVVIAWGPTLALMDSTIITIILSRLQIAFHTDLGTITWVSTAYYLAQAGVIPVVGYVSDRLGSKLVFITSLALFTVSSLLCALAPTQEALIAFRVLQGIGGGALVPIALAIVFRLFPPNQQGLVTAIMSIPIMLAPTFGPTIGGYLISSFDWNAVFLINVPLGLVTLFLSFLVLPKQSKQAKGINKSFDIAGLLLSMVGATALIYGISEVAAKGWSEATVWASLLIGVAALIAFAVIELRVSDPVLDLRLFKNYAFTLSNLLTWLSIGVYSGSIFLFPLFFERVRGDSAVLTGLFLISPGLATGAGVIIAGPLYNRLGPRILTTFGMFLLICGTYGLTQITLNTTGQELQIWLILSGLGLGFAYQPLQTLGLSVVSKEGMAKASSLINMTRQVATAMAVATVSTYLTQQIAIYRIAINDALQTGLQTHQFTSVAAACVQAVGSIQNMTALNACAGQQALANGMADTFWIILILSAACIPLALAIKGNVESLAAKGDTATLTANSDPAVLSTKGDMTALALKGDAAVLTLKSDSAVLAMKGDSAVLTLKSDSAVLTLKSEPEIKTPETRQAADRELEESTARAASARD